MATLHIVIRNQVILEKLFNSVYYFLKYEEHFPAVPCLLYIRIKYSRDMTDEVQI